MSEEYIPIERVMTDDMMCPNGHDKLVVTQCPYCGYYLVVCEECNEVFKVKDLVESESD